MRISERTLYEPIIRYLRTLGVRGFQEIGAQIGKGWTDVLCELGDGTRVVVEYRFGSKDDRSTLIIDAVRHARESRTTNFAAVLYPTPASRVLIDDEVDSFALDSPTWASAACEWWTNDLEDQVSVRDFLRRLFDPSRRKEKLFDFDTVVNSLQAEIEILSKLLRRAIGSNGRSALAQAVGRFESFVTLSGIKKTDKQALNQIRTAAIDLVAFILVNQLVFYRTYSLQVKDKKLPKLPTSEATLQNVKECIDAIADINYDPIYGIDILGTLEKLESKASLVDEIGTFASLLPVLRPEQVSHDLLGRMLHDLLPDTTRNVLGAFFTTPEAGELLAAIALDHRWGLPERPTVLDPACGSGTLLVSAYRYLLRHERPSDKTSFHREMNASRITGIDVMPFAASMTATNLAAQDVAATITNSRVVMADSLDLSYDSTIPQFSVSLQKTLEELGVTPKASSYRRERGTVSAKGKGSPVTLYRPDCVLMNPPFTAWEDLPDDIRRSVERHQSLTDLAGGTANLWQLFIALVFDWGKEGTVYGLVSPVNIFQGARTRTIRELVYKRTTLLAVIVNQAGIGFAKSQQYRNVLMVFQKRDPNEKDSTKVVHLFSDFESEGIEGAAQLGERLANVVFEDADPPEDCRVFDVQWDPKAGLDELVGRVLSTATPERDIIESFYDEVISRGKNYLRKIERGEIWEGFGPRPKGVSAIAIVRRDTPGLPAPTPRTRQAGLVLVSDKGHILRFRVKVPQGVKPEGKLARTYTTRWRREFAEEPSREVGAVQAVATLAGLRTIDLDSVTDFVVLGPYQGWETVKALSGWSERKNKSETATFHWKDLVVDPVRASMTRLTIADAIQQNSPDTFVLAVAKREPFAITNLQYGVNTHDAADARAKALWFNSVATQIFFATHQTGGLAGGLTRLKISEWEKHRMLDTRRLTDEDRNILESAWNDGAHRPLKAILELETDRSRLELDVAVLRALGWPEKEARARLPEVYRALATEIHRITARLGPAAEDDSQAQTTLTDFEPEDEGSK